MATNPGALQNAIEAARQQLTPRLLAPQETPLSQYFTDPTAAGPTGNNHGHPDWQSPVPLPMGPPTPPGSGMTGSRLAPPSPQATPGLLDSLRGQSAPESKPLVAQRQAVTPAAAEAKPQSFTGPRQPFVPAAAPVQPSIQEPEPATSTTPRLQTNLNPALIADSRPGVAAPQSNRSLGTPSNTPLVRSAAPPDPAMDADRTELARLTKPGLPSSDPNAHTKLDTGRSGIGQIHSPILRALAHVGETLGSMTWPTALAMRAIPGTESHHNMLVSQRQGYLDEDEKRATEGATRDKLGADTSKAEADADEAQARAGAIKNPPAKQPTNLLEWFHQAHPDKTPEDFAKFEQENKPAVEKGGTVHQLEDGSLIVAHPDGSATPVMVDGKPAKGKVATEKQTPEEQAIAEYRAANPKATIQEAREKTKIVTPEKPKTELVEVPDGKGGFITKEVGNGASLPAGARTLGGVSGEATKESEANTAAEKSRSDAQHEYQLAQQLVAHPSPTNDVALIMRYIGATKPDSLGKLRLNQNEVNMVLGTRSTFGDLEAFAQKVQNGEKLTPKQRQDMLDSMKLLTGQNQGGGVDPKLKAYADQYFGGDTAKAQAAIDTQRKGK